MEWVIGLGVLVAAVVYVLRGWAEDEQMKREGRQQKVSE